MLTDSEVQDAARALLWSGETFEAAGCVLPAEDQQRICELLETWGYEGFKIDTQFAGLKTNGNQ